MINTPFREHLRFLRESLDDYGPLFLVGGAARIYDQATLHNSVQISLPKDFDIFTFDASAFDCNVIKRQVMSHPLCETFIQDQYKTAEGSETFYGDADTNYAFEVMLKDAAKVVKVDLFRIVENGDTITSRRYLNSMATAADGISFMMCDDGTMMRETTREYEKYLKSGHNFFVDGTVRRLIKPTGKQWKKHCKRQGLKV